jgi:hypothetical protein
MRSGHTHIRSVISLPGNFPRLAPKVAREILAWGGGLPACDMIKCLPLAVAGGRTSGSPLHLAQLCLSLNLSPRVQPGGWPLSQPGTNEGSQHQHWMPLQEASTKIHSQPKVQNAGPPQGLQPQARPCPSPAPLHQPAPSSPAYMGCFALSHLCSVSAHISPQV